jgi:methylamine dehydrogenase light chain
MPDSRADSLGEKIVRQIARRSSRRGFLSKFAGILVAAPAIPLLPVARATAAERKPVAKPRGQLTDFERNAQTSDPHACDYWRHCAIDGIICGCCGGGVHTCPPGAEPSPTAWVGTCLNPDDGRSYLIAYRDCCGKGGCVPTGENCHCNSQDRELPVYRPQTNNDIIWCFGNASMEYHCSTAAIVGVAE